MAKKLNGSAIEAFWSGTSFLLTCTVFQPVLGSFSTVFGRKPILILSLAFFGIGAIVAALANDFGVILVGRSIQGIGGGGILVLEEVIVTDMVPLRDRGKWMSVVSAVWALGTVVGPVLGRSTPDPSRTLLTCNQVADFLRMSPGDGFSGSTFLSSASERLWS